MPRLIGLIFLLACMITTGIAQEAVVPAFDVVSIKRNMVGFAADTFRVEGGRYTGSNVTVDQLVRAAYRMTVVGGPEWAKDSPGPPKSGEVRFDVIATIPPGTPPAQVPLMLRRLLAERFNLVAHIGTERRPTYALVYARQDKRLGPKLTPSTQQCQTEIEAGSLRAPVKRTTEDGKPVCGMMLGRSIIGGGLTITFLASALSGPTGRTVVDHTGLEGPFDFELRYAPTGVGATPPSVPDSAASGLSATKSGTAYDQPSIFVAVQEQLGLKLEATVESVPVLIIDSVSMPTEN